MGEFGVGEQDHPLYGLRMRNVPGVCKLCLEEKGLKKSHILPAWSFAGLRGDNDPAILYSRKFGKTIGEVRASNYEIRERMLCETCETLMSKWEGCVRNLAYINGKTGILERIGSDVIRGAGHGDERCYMFSASHLEFEKIAQFGVSVIWRAAVAQRRDTGKPRLGPKYEEVIRLYLTGESAFPESAGLMVAVMDDPEKGEPDLRRISSFPTTVRSGGGFHYHSFLTCGILFHMAVGKLLPKKEQANCIIHCLRNPVLVIPGYKMGVAKILGPMVAEAQPVGRLARRGRESVG